VALQAVESEFGVSYGEWKTMPMEERQFLHRAWTAKMVELAKAPGAEIPWNPEWDMRHKLGRREK